MSQDHGSDHLISSLSGHEKAIIGKCTRDVLFRPLPIIGGLFLGYFGFAECTPLQDRGNESFFMVFLPSCDIFPCGHPQIILGSPVEDSHAR